MSRGLIAGCVLVVVVTGAFLWGWTGWRGSSSRGPKDDSGPTIVKQPVNFANRSFDPGNPPSEMPPLTGGEDAECDSNFLASANVSGQTQAIDSTHATLTITKIKMTLQLNISIWVPNGIAQHVIEHEEGHRQISEYYYQTADRLAERIAAKYMGQQIEISGSDLNSESNKTLQQMATEITDEYNKELNPEPTQLLYDTITDHSRNDVVAKDAVAHAIKNAVVESHE